MTYEPPFAAPLPLALEAVRLGLHAPPPATLPRAGHQTCCGAIRQELEPCHGCPHAGPEDGP